MSTTLPISIVESTQESKEDENLSVVELQITEPPTVTQTQRALVQSLYEDAKRLTAIIWSSTALDSSVKITQLIAQLMVLVESVQLEGQKISGMNKKAVVLELGRLLLRDLIKDDIERAQLLLMYDVLAEKILEAMIQMSHAVNIQGVKETLASSSCWDCLVSWCRAKPLTEEEKKRKLASQCI